MTDDQQPLIDAVIAYDTSIPIGQQLGTQKKPHTRHPFSPEEDQLLRELVVQHGTNAWREIETMMPGRNARQCRERWNQYLNPTLANQPWTQEEDAQLLNYFAVLGPKWTLIANQFPQRTANSIKNRIKVHIRRDARDRLHTAGADAADPVGTGNPVLDFHAHLVEKFKENGVNIQTPTSNPYDPTIQPQINQQDYMGFTLQGHDQSSIQ